MRTSQSAAKGAPESRTDIPSKRQPPQGDLSHTRLSRAALSLTEGDLVIGAGQASAIITLVERHTRYVMLGALPGSRASQAVVQVLVELMRRLPAELGKTLTWDQGSELAQHATFTLATDCRVYFCDPHSPWQRGSNENTNGLLRQYFPKGITDFRTYTQDDLDAVARELNPDPPVMWVLVRVVT